MKNAEEYAVYDHHYKVTNIRNYDDILSADNEEYIYIYSYFTYRLHLPVSGFTIIVVDRLLLLSL
jgi:hypothetical protein